MSAFAVSHGLTKRKRARSQRFVISLSTPLSTRSPLISWYESPVIVIPHRHRTGFSAIKDGYCFLRSTDEDLVGNANTCLLISGPFNAWYATGGAEPGCRHCESEALQHHQAEASRWQAGFQLHAIEDGYRRLLRAGQALRFHLVRNAAQHAGVRGH